MIQIESDGPRPRAQDRHQNQSAPATVPAAGDNGRDPRRRPAERQPRRLALARTPEPESVPWCGRCKIIGGNRLDIAVIRQPDGREVAVVRRCPDCHPYAGQGCGEHVTPPGEACQLCLHDIGPRGDGTYGGPPPAVPMPREPVDLWGESLPLQAIIAERAELREPALPARNGPRTEKELAFLRDLAARQAQSARARRERASRD